MIDSKSWRRNNHKLRQFNESGNEMEIFCTCMACLRDPSGPTFQPFMASYYEDRIVDIECPRGHKVALLPQAQKFEILMDSGARALTRGFTLEASATYAAAFERLIEFGVKVMLDHLGMLPETYDKMFKEMSRQSERQLGAFLALFPLIFAKTYTPNQKVTEFRNAYIHKGQIPDPEEATRFCALVYAEVYVIAEGLRATCKDSVQKVVQMDLAARRARLADDTLVATSANVGIYSLANEKNFETFAEANTAYEESESKMGELMRETAAAFEDAMKNPEARARFLQQR